MHNEEFKTSKGTLDYFCAPQLLNRYCMALPCDMFTEPAVQWTEKCEKGLFVITIILPIQSPVRDEISVSTIRIAN